MKKWKGIKGIVSMILSLMLIFTMVFGITGCSSGDEPVDGDPVEQGTGGVGRRLIRMAARRLQAASKVSHPMGRRQLTSLPREVHMVRQVLKLLMISR